MNATFSPEVFQLILPAEAEQESSEETYRSPSDDCFSSTEDDY